MTLPPGNPKIYHITHIDNLPKIAEAGCLWSDRSQLTHEVDVNVIGMPTADFFSKKSDLEQIDWDAVNARDFRDRQIQERKQAEFLIVDSFPWPLVEHIGVFNQNRAALANEAIQSSLHRPTIQVENGWYF